ncbi:MAG: SDR family NAD(P)-dependent oxidoreductase [bacterium]
MADQPFDLSGKKALVTGGNSGIGLGMAKALAAAGAEVCVWGTNEAKNEAAAAELATVAAVAGGRTLAMRCNVADAGEVEARFGEVLGEFGRVDACFANAGVGSARSAPFSEMTDEEWRRVLGVNLDGAFFTLRVAARHMMERGGGGSLVTTSSLSALEGAPKSEHYAASKGGLIAMTKGLAVELGRHAIRANVIVPGWIDTPMTSAFFQLPAVRKRIFPRVPLGRWGTGDDFGGIAVYLASDASRYHTGDTFVIDGGYALF